MFGKKKDIFLEKLVVGDTIKPLYCALPVEFYLVS